jgi:drug/metabolite transporter (DMT)-like permease
MSPAEPRHHLLGIAFVIGAASCFATMDTTVRYVGAHFSVALVLWARYGLHASIMTLWIALSRQRSFRSANPMFQIARGALLAFSSAMAFAALRRMPVAEFTAIVMLTPVVATVVARLWLKEQVSRLRWALVVGGFLGALIVVRPGSGLVGWAALLPLAATFSNAAFQIMTSRYAPHEDPFTTNFYTGATGVTIATPLLLWRVPGGFLPILLGDYLLLHFAVYGMLTALGLWLSRPRRVPLRAVRPLALGVAALAATLYAVFAIGLPLDRYLTSFAPTGQRGPLVLAVFAGALPYFLADEWLVRGASHARGAYAFTKLLFLVSIALAIALNPERLFFLAIVTPVILLAFVIYGLFSRWVFHSIGHPWAGALANAAAFAWLIAVTFPVVSP